MSTFHFETSSQEWEVLRRSWTAIVQKIQESSDENIDKCVNLLNNKLFSINNSDNKNNDKNKDQDNISIETMNNLLLEIDNDIKKNDTVGQTPNQLKSLYSSHIAQFIKTPVNIFIKCTYCMLFTTYFCFA